MKIIFFGSDDFAAANLERLIASDYEIVACVTQPDRSKGRGLKLTSPVVKECASRENIPVLQPERLDEPSLIEELKKFGADLFVVIAYGRILPSSVLAVPKIFSINVHASLLPKYRGAAPINWAVINGDQASGISIIKLNETMDAGEIISQQDVTVDETDDAVSLRAKLMQQSPQLLMSTIRSIEENSHKLTKQDLAGITYAPKLTKELGAIQWGEKASTIHNLIRGLVPWPGAFTFFDGKLLKMLKSKISDAETGQHQPGEVISVSKEGITVATGSGALLIETVHLESAKQMDAKSFAAGHKVREGYKFG